MPAGSAAVSRAFAWLVLVAPTKHARLAFRRSAQDLLPQDLPPQDLPPIAAPQMKTPTHPKSRRANTQPRQPLQPSPNVILSGLAGVRCAMRKRLAGCQFQERERPARIVSELVTSRSRSGQERGGGVYID